MEMFADVSKSLAAAKTQEVEFYFVASHSGKSSIGASVHAAHLYIYVQVFMKVN